MYNHVEMIISKKFIFVSLAYLLLFFLCFLGDDVVERVLVYVLLVLCTGRLAWSFCKTNEFLIFDPLNYFLLNYFFIHGIGYFCYLSRLSIGISEYEHNSSLIQTALIVSIVALLTMFVAFWIGSRGYSVYNHINSSPHDNETVYVNEKTWIILILFIFLSFSLLWALMGGVPFFTPGFHESGRAEMGQGLGLVEAICNTFVSVSSFYYIWKILRGEKFNMFSGLYFLCVIALLTLNDSRSAVVGYCLQFAMIYYFCARHFSLKSYITGAFLVILFAAAMGVQRARSSEGGWIELGAVLSTEMFVEFDNYVETFNMYEDKGGLGGSTLLPVLTVPVPRAILPDKDKYLTAGNYFKEYHGHWHIRVGERMTYIGELLLNWGIPGVIIGMIIMGLFLSFVVCGFKQFNDVLSIFLLINFSFFPIGFIAGDIVTNIVGFFMTNIWFIFFYVLRFLLKDSFICKRIYS